jgi:aquaporin Z
MSQRSRILLAEAVGTGILVLGGPGTAILGSGVGTLGVALAFGLSLLIAVYLVGAVSGCHINPAVTLGMWWTKRMDLKDALMYWGAQVFGGLVGAAVIWAVLRFGETGNRVDAFTGASNGYGDHSPAGYQLGGVIFAEVALTAVLVLVVLSVTKSTLPAGFAAIPIGFTLALVHLISIPVDNTSVNPARSIAMVPFAHESALEQVWVFIVFPLIGGAIGAIAWQVMNGEKLALPFGTAWLGGFGKSPASTRSTASTASKRMGSKSSFSWLSGFGKHPPSATTPAKKAPTSAGRKTSTKKTTARKR